MTKSSPPRTLGQARSLRRRMTATEASAWTLLRDRRLEGLKFRRQVPIERFIVDFACFEHKLVLELDGGVHALKAESDAARDGALSRMGFRVLRVSDGLVGRPHDFLNTVRGACNLPPLLPSYPRLQP